MLLPGILVANIGVPMLALLWPAHWWALGPMVFLAGQLGHQRLQVPRRSVIKAALVANLASTAVAVPLVWLGMLALEIGAGAALAAFDVPPSSVLRHAAFPLRAAWLDPTEDAWRVYLAFAILLVPCCLASMFTQYIIARRMLAGAQPRLLRAWIQSTHLWSYLLLLSVAAAFPLAAGGVAW
jgi:hypothetical protein